MADKIVIEVQGSGFTVQGYPFEGLTYLGTGTK